MTILTYYLSCEYDLPKKSDREAFLNIVELTLNRSRFQIALDDKIQLFDNNPKGCLETCEKFVVEYFHEKPEFVAAWRNYGKNVIVTMPAIWEMSSDVSNAKISFYLEPLLIYGWIKQMNDKPAVLSKLFFEDSKKYNTDILKGMKHSPTELKAFNDICEMAECYLPKA